MHSLFFFKGRDFFFPPNWYVYCFISYCLRNLYMNIACFEQLFSYPSLLIPSFYLNPTTFPPNFMPKKIHRVPLVLYVHGCRTIYWNMDNFTGAKPPNCLFPPSAANQGRDFLKQCHIWPFSKHKARTSWRFSLQLMMRLSKP